MTYDFNKRVCRCNTNCSKWDTSLEQYKNKDVLPLWVADMDFEVDDNIVKAMEDRMKHHVFGYTYIGHDYYNAVISWMKERHDWDVKEEWIRFTPGVVPGLSHIIAALTEEGDEIIIQSPVYHQFYRVIDDNKCKVVENPLVLKDGKYFMDLEDFEKKITPKTKMFILCSPHNPVGRVWSKEELKALGEICLRHNIIVVSDEIHSDIVYKGYEHTVFSTVSKELENISIIATAPNKTFNIAGLQTANIIIANKDIREKLEKQLKKACIGEPNIFGGIAQEAAYSKGEEWYKALMEYLEENKDFAIDFIEKRIPELSVIHPEGTYLLWVDFSKLNMSTEELEEFLVEKCGVRFNSGVSFGKNGAGFERINIGTQREVIKEALERVEKGIKELKNK